MDRAERRRRRLAQLLDLAQNYKGWTRKALASALGRDPTKLIPGSGIPKIDLVIDLSGVLDWNVGDVVEYLWQDSTDTSSAPAANDDFEALDAEAKEAHRRGDYAEMVELARRARQKATTPEERARTANREAGGWDGLGRYSEVLKAIQGGLAQSPIAADVRRMLQSNLAQAYYSLWSLVESRAIATELIGWYRDHRPESVRDRRTEAFAHYVSGHSYRRLVSAEPDRATEYAEHAKKDLERAAELYRQLSRELDDPSYDGIANTCHGGLIEVEVALGRRKVHEALDELTNGLDNVLDTSENPGGDWSESYGWWCIFGCNIALRYLSDEREVQQYMAVFTNKADEIAERLNNWCIRERVFTMEHSRWERAVGCTGFDIPRVVDEEDVRVITGTMARFPSFRDTGWRILHSAKVVRAN